MAGDCRISDDYGSLTVPSKLSIVGHAILGMAGDASAMGKFYRWLRAGGKRRRPRFTKSEEIEALLLTPAGLFYYDASCEPLPVGDPFYAIGALRINVWKLLTREHEASCGNERCRYGIRWPCSCFARLGRRA